MAGQHWRVHMREQRSEPFPTGIITSIGAPTQTAVTGVVSAGAPPLTSVIATFSLSGGRFSTFASVVTDPADFASIQSSEAAQRASSTNDPSTTRANTAATSSQAAAKSSNSSTLIPAIVVPIAVVLLASFAAFWFFMRRRTLKAIKSEPEFVMEGMKEKPRSRPVTADSDSSTQKLVPNKNKEAMIDIKEFDRPSLDLFPPKELDSDNRAPRADSAMSGRPDSRQQSEDASGKSKAIPNFSRGPRPGTAGRDSTASPAPSFSQRDRNPGPPVQRSPPSALRFNNRPPSPGRRGPSGPPQNSKPRGAPSSAKGPPTSINTATQHVPRQSVSSPPAPPGAYNGASPISQYSPIVKEVPKFGTSPMAARQNAEARAAASAAAVTEQAASGIRKPPPSAIKTGKRPGLPDPTFSEENMQIARLANNSRLGFSHATSPTAATEEPPTPSPRLPPPATRDAPPTNYNIPIPTHEPAAPASIQSRLNGVSISDRRSVVSGLSDDYVDMEVDDNKSDVSSLDEREKWQMENEREDLQQGGLGVYSGAAGSLRPPLLSSPNPESGFSETSGSQYSLGKY